MTERIKIEEGLLASILQQDKLWDDALSLSRRHFGPVRDSLFGLLRGWYLRYGTVMEADQMESLLERSKLRDRDKQSILREFLKLKRMKADRVSRWEIDELHRLNDESEIVSNIEKAVKALTGGYTEDERFYVGTEGARKLLDRGLERVEQTERDLSPFEAYKITTSGEVVAVPLLSPLIDEFVRRELWLLVGFTEEGKTTVALNLSLSLAFGGERSLYLNMESSSHQLYWKLASMASQDIQFPGDPLPYYKIKRRELDKAREKDFAHILEWVQEWITVIDVPVGVSKGELQSAINGAKRAKEYCMVVVDNISLMAQRSDGYSAYLGEIIKWLKKLAKSDKLVVLALHQTNREGFQRAKKAGRYDFLALSDTNEAERSPDGILWVLRTDYLRSRLGLLKLRDEIRNPEAFVEWALDGDTYRMAPITSDMMEEIGKPVELKGELPV